MRNLRRVILLAVLVAAGVWLWGILFPNPEKIIRTRLQEIAELASFPANQPPLSALMAVQQLCARVSPDVEVALNAPGIGQRTAHGREELREAARYYFSSVNGAKIEFPDIRVTVAPAKQSAEVHATLKARVAPDPDLAVHELKLEFRKLDGKWLVSRAETVQTLR